MKILYVSLIFYLQFFTLSHPGTTRRGPGIFASLIQEI